MSIQSLALDIVAAAILFSCIVYYARKGFVAGLIQFVGTLVAFILAIILSKQLTVVVFNTFFRARMESSIALAINEYKVTDVESLITEQIRFMPQEWVAKLVETLNPHLDFSSADIAQQVVSQVIEPIVSPFISVILFLLLFGFFRFLVRLLRTLVGGIARMPGLSTLNSALGAGIGVFVGGLYVYIAMCFVWAYENVNPVAGPYFTHSFVYNLLLPFNILTGL